MATVLIIHPDPDVRARLAEALQNPTAGVGSDVQLGQVDSVEAAVEVEPRPDAIVTHLPPRAGPDRTDGRSASLLDALQFLPTVVVLDDQEPESLGRALSLEPAGVLHRDVDPALAGVAMRCALANAGTVLDRSLTPSVLELLKR